MEWTADSEDQEMRCIREGHRAAGTLLFLFYLLGLAYFLFFSEALGRTESEEYHYNLVLFREIRRFWSYRELLGYKAFLLNMVGNVVALIPFGFFLPIVSGRRHTGFCMLLMGILLSVFIELLQLVTRLGSFDVDDILLNTIGTMMGYLIFRIFFRRVSGV
jgi:hypothetical protein